MAMKALFNWLGLIGIIHLVLMICPWPALASTLQVEAGGAMLSIQANGVPLGEVLRAVSEKSGIVIISDEPLTEEVTCGFTGLTLEQGVMKLLENRSYALMFNAQQEAASSPAVLWILGKVSLQSDINLKERLAKEVEDSGRLSRQFTAMSLGTQTKGIKITSLTPDSVFRKMGINQGDFVSRVNGLPTETVEEFISVLKSVPQESSTIMMIERRTPDGRLDPIYVQFEAIHIP